MENADRPVTGCGNFFLSELNETQTNNGLTKREHFAGLAMQGLLTNPNIVNRGGTMKDSELVQRMAVSYADNLLKELDK